MLSLDDRGRRTASLVVLGVGILNVIVGLNQIAQGPSSPLRFYAYTNPTEAVGFFANRNHLAALLYCVTVIAAAWAVEAVRVFEAARARREGRAIVPLAAAFAVLVALVAAQAMARSRGGLGLTMVALAGAFALSFFDRRDTSGFTPGRLLVGTTAFAVMFASQFALYRIMERFSTDQLEDSRIVFARNTIEAAKAYMPLGSGMGTFVPVYGMFEKPEDALLDAYVNRAHNDVLELWLEFGRGWARADGRVRSVARRRILEAVAAGRGGCCRHRFAACARRDAGHRLAWRTLLRRLPHAHNRHDGVHGLRLRPPDRADPRRRERASRGPIGSKAQEDLKAGNYARARAAAPQSGAGFARARYHHSRRAVGTGYRVARGVA